MSAVRMGWFETDGCVGWTDVLCGVKRDGCVGWD